MARYGSPILVLNLVRDMASLQHRYRHLSCRHKCALGHVLSCMSSCPLFYLRLPAVTVVPVAIVVWVWVWVRDYGLAGEEE